MKKILLIFMLLLFVNGCSYKEINELAIADAIGIDYEDGKYYISVQVMDFQKSSDTISENSLLYKGNGKSIAEAFRNISLKYPKTLYLGHTQLLIIGKDVIEIGYDDIFEYFIRSPEARNDSYLLVSTDNKASKILEITKENEQSFPVKDIISTLKNTSDREGSTIFINVEEFVSDMLKKGKDPVVTNIAFEKEKGSANAKLNNTILKGIVSIKDNKYYKFSEEESIAYNLLNNNFYDIVLNADYKGNIASLVLFNPKCSYEIKIENKEIILNINIKLEGHVSEVYDEVNLQDDNILKELENSAIKKIESYVEDLLNNCKNNNIDILGLKNYIYKHYYKKYNTYKNSNIYKEATININTNINIYRSGNAHLSSSRR